MNYIFKIYNFIDIKIYLYIIINNINNINNIKMIKIFTIHYKKLTERKINIINQLEKFGLQTEFVDKFDRDILNDKNLYIFDSNKLGTKFKASAAITLSHIYCFYNISISNDYSYALILEDDALLSDNFLNQLNNYISQLPGDWDMVFIGDGCNLHIEKKDIKPNINIYKKCLYPTQWGGDGATRCTDSYLVNKKCAVNLCQYINTLSYKIDDNIDWWLNKVSRDNNFNVYWAEPTIVTQGTQNGKYKSSH